MIGTVTVKRLIKRGAGLAAAVEHAVLPVRKSRRACILMYHRVARIPFVDPHVDDWNVTPELFEEQISALAETAKIVPLRDVLRWLEEPDQTSKPIACLTFDDGYANFATNALPVLQRYDAPATLFVVTSVVGKKGPMPFDAWSRLHVNDVPDDAWTAIGWDQLERCVATGLVSVGSHSHRHRNGLKAAMRDLFLEAEESRSTLLARLGEDAGTTYSYPYGSRRLHQVSDEYVEAVREAGYSLAVTTDLGLASASSDPLALPRVEVHAVDRPGVLRAKVAGALAPFHMPDMLRRAERTGDR